MLPLLVPAAGAVLWFGAWLSDQGKSVSASVTGIPQVVDNKQGAVPSWVIPAMLVVVGGVLLYKTGAKVLKV